MGLAERHAYLATLTDGTDDMLRKIAAFSCGVLAVFTASIFATNTLC